MDNSGSEADRTPGLDPLVRMAACLGQPSSEPTWCTDSAKRPTSQPVAIPANLRPYIAKTHEAETTLGFYDICIPNTWNPQELVLWVMHNMTVEEARVVLSDEGKKVIDETFPRLIFDTKDLRRPEYKWLREYLGNPDEHGYSACYRISELIKEGTLPQDFTRDDFLAFVRNAVGPIPWITHKAIGDAVLKRGPKRDMTKTWKGRTAQADAAAKQAVKGWIAAMEREKRRGRTRQRTEQARVHAQLNGMHENTLIGRLKKSGDWNKFV